MNCPHCGTAVPDGSAFCTYCGKATGEATGSTVAVETPRRSADPSAQTVAIQLDMTEDTLFQQVKEALSADYEVESELGRGGMAVVFRATERQLNRVVALKVVTPEMAGAAETGERFRREARLAAALEHPSILPIFRVGQVGNLIYMAMKFVEGRGLDSIVEQQGALPLNVVLKVLRDASSALAYAHEHHIVHRDIKGANILIDKDGRVLVSDFGIARAMDETSLTKSGMIIGTPSYMSPEQCGGQKVGPQSDQYSLGILAFQLLTGQLPFEADSIMGVIQHHYMTPPPDITLVRDSVPPELLTVIYKALEKEKDHRYKSTEDMAEALEVVPDTPEARKEAIAHLKQLSHGQRITEIRTGSLPPLALVTGPGAVVTGPRTIVAREKRSKLWLPIAAVAVLGLAAGGYWAVAVRGGTSAAQDSTATPTAALGSGPGEVRFEGMPRNARVQVGDSVLAGGRGYVEAGRYTYTVTARGYIPATGPIAVAAGVTTRQIVALSRDPNAPAADPVASAPPTGAEPAPQPTGTTAAPAPSAATGQLRIRASETAAEIFVDGQRVGSGSRILSVPAGSHTIRVSLAGFETFTTTVTVTAGETTPVMATLRATGGGG